MNKLLALSITFLFICRACAYEITNLDDLQSDFIIEAKRIEIPGIPDAFNPSIIRHDGVVLMSFRYRDPITLSTDHMGFVWLDDNLDVIGTPFILERRNELLSGVSMAQDPRLISVKGQLYITYNNMVNVRGRDTRRMIVAPLNYDGVLFYTDTYTTVLDFEGENNAVLQKNWIPFNYLDELLLIYSIKPHRIELPILGSEKSSTVAWSDSEIDFEWGDLRGGTNAVLDGDKYISVFHSTKYLVSEQSEKKYLLHYFMGAYTFSATPPFNITSISSQPIVDSTFYNGPMYKTWKPLRCVFPCGLIVDDDYIWVSYGRQDFECWVIKLNKAGLLSSLKKL